MLVKHVAQRNMLRRHQLKFKLDSLVAFAALMKRILLCGTNGRFSLLCGNAANFQLSQRFMRKRRNSARVSIIIGYNAIRPVVPSRPRQCFIQAIGNVANIQRSIDSIRNYILCGRHSFSLLLQVRNSEKYFKTIPLLLLCTQNSGKYDTLFVFPTLAMPVLVYAYTTGQPPYVAPRSLLPQPPQKIMGQNPVWISTCR